MALQWLGDDVNDWPDVAEAQRERDGLVAVGGDLNTERLLAAYQRGIFPWYSEDQPICWWALSPRMVLKPENLHVGRSLVKNIRNRHYAISVNQQFSAVINACARMQRPGQDGTWLTQELQWALKQMYRAGHAQLGGPDLVGIMLDPARFGKILGEFFLGHAANFAVVVKQDAAVRGRSGVKRHNVLFHKALPLAGICDD